MVVFSQSGRLPRFTPRGMEVKGGVRDEIVSQGRDDVVYSKQVEEKGHRYVTVLSLEHSNSLFPAPLTASTVTSKYIILISLHCEFYL